MSFVSVNWPPRDDRPAPARKAKARRTAARKSAAPPALFRVEQLEAREVPAVSLIDVNSSVLGGGNGNAEVLAVTPNGRYAIFSSTANDLVPQQNDTPGTKDLFWIDFLTGSRKLVTGAPSSGGGGTSYTYAGTTTAFGRAFSGVESFNQAVISDDGQFVAFTSKVNAGLLDATFATKQQLSGSPRSAPGDRGDTSYDAFRWNAKSGQILLASRTFDDKNAPTEAFGFRAEVGNSTPDGRGVGLAISADGSKVAYVSNRNAAFVYPQPPAGKPGVMRDSGDNSPDLFLTDMVRIETGVAQNTTVVSQAPNPYPSTFTKFANFFFREDAATFGFLAQFVAVEASFNTFLVAIVDVNGVIVDVIGEPPRVPYTPVSVRVDPLGRYMNGVGDTMAFLSDISPAFPFSQLAPNEKTAPLTEQRLDVYLHTVANVDPGSNLNARVPTIADQTAAVAGGNPIDPTSTLAVEGGTADNAIVARDNSDRVLFTAAVTDLSNGTLVPGFLGPAGARFQQMNLYLREHPVGSIAGETPILVNAIGDNGVSPGNIPSGAPAGTGALPADPNSPDAQNPRVDPRAYQITPDGQFVVFTSISSDLLPVGKGVPIDKNTATDVFRRDINQTAVNLANPGSPNLPASIVSVTANFRGTATGNAASKNPTVSPDGRFVAFETLASDIVPTGIDANKVSDVYVRDFQATKNTKGQFVAKSGLASSNPDGSAAGNAASFRPLTGTGRVVFTSLAGNLTPNLEVVTGTQHGYAADLPIATAGGGGGSVDVGAVGGGFQAAAALVRFTGNGNLAFSDKFTPFPGFTGELRVAAADVNADGTPDLIAGSGAGGGPRVVVIDGLTGSRTLTRTETLADGTTKTSTYSIDLFAFESSFRGGVTIASADVNGDLFSDLIIGADNGGGSRVRVISGFNGKTVLADFFAYEATFRGGVRVGAGDVNGDGTPDVITGAGFGGGPRVSVFSFRDPAAPGQLFNLPDRIVDFFAFEPTLRNGVYVGGGDIDGDGFDEVVVGGGPGGGPRVTAFDGKTLFAATTQGADVLANFFAFPEQSRNGVRVAVRDIDGNGTGDLLVGQGSGEQSRVRTYLLDDPESKREPVLIDDVLLFGDFGSLNGAWVG